MLLDLGHTLRGEHNGGMGIGRNPKLESVDVPTAEELIQ
jgi:hypothetical protein